MWNEPPACRCSGAPDVGEYPHPDPGLADSVEGCAVEAIAGRMRGLLLIEPCCPACATPRRSAHGCGAHYQSSASFSGDDAPNRGNSRLAAHRGGGERHWPASTSFLRGAYQHEREAAPAKMFSANGPAGRQSGRAAQCAGRLLRRSRVSSPARRFAQAPEHQIAIKLSR